MEKIAFADLLDKIGDEIREANRRAVRDNDAVMEFTECEVEVGFSVEAEAKGGLKIYVFEASAGATTTTTNTIKLKYQALPDNSFVGVVE